MSQPKIDLLSPFDPLPEIRPLTMVHLKLTGTTVVTPLIWPNPTPCYPSFLGSVSTNVNVAHYYTGLDPAIVTPLSFYLYKIFGLGLV